MLARQRILYCCLWFVPSECNCDVFSELRKDSPQDMNRNARSSRRGLSVVFVQFQGLFKQITTVSETAVSILTEVPSAFRKTDGSSIWIRWRVKQLRVLKGQQRISALRWAGVAYGLANIYFLGTNTDYLFTNSTVV